MNKCQCAFCGKTEEREKACDLGWHPYFYIGDVMIDQEVCLECSHHVKMDDNFECEIAHDFDGLVYRYDFVLPDHTLPDHTDVFRYLREPPQEMVDFIADHRPECEIIRCVEKITFTKEV